MTHVAFNTESQCFLVRQKEDSFVEYTIPRTLATVVRWAIPHNKVDAIKAVRAIAVGISLKDAKVFCDYLQDTFDGRYPEYTLDANARTVYHIDHNRNEE